jgi:hypothetical protein
MTYTLIKTRLEEIHKHLKYAINQEDTDLAEEAADDIANLIEDIRKAEDK